MHSHITVDYYADTEVVVTSKIQNNKPSVYFEHDPEVYWKTHALTLVALHTKWEISEICEFVKKHTKQIQPRLTNKPICPHDHWTKEEIISYANIVISVINETEA